ncbi:coiled-coil domain-containing protein [Flavobacterium restrictum]|uniref:DUF1640 domain-containing protein n=1 Tax=Flavobacterium restrictum TaxID=2594428 RepID=A0A553E8H5_9FLAO|nr:coiled-coil domain-containing protein [Flavobacterium restrictum]TRX41364.1 DUF1640 domain-containing protein [Flavobacterium restrictum]
MNTVNLNLYQILKTDFKLSDAKAKEFVDAIREEVQNDIKYENSDFKSSVKEDFLKLELKLEQVNTKIESIKGDLKNEIKESKNDMLKWFVGMFFALALMIIGLYLKK